jgi:hypothetical protein
MKTVIVDASVAAYWFSAVFGAVDDGSGVTCFGVSPADFDALSQGTM